MVDSLLTFAAVFGVLALAYLLLGRGAWYGPGVIALSVVPLIAARLGGLTVRRLIPDLIFGAIDSGLLVIAASLGAWRFGLAGAVVGGVVGDAVTDGIAGYFEGGIAQWLRRRGVEESRTALGSANGKMAGCLLGAGAMLTLLQLGGVDFTRLAAPR
jgi:hypothetical protein